MNIQMSPEDMEEENRNLVRGALAELGCECQPADDGSLVVLYQSESFIMNFNARFVRIWLPFWNSTSIDDSELPVIREIFNSANFGFGATALLSRPDEGGKIYYHSRYDIMIHPGIPAMPKFIQAILNSFFDNRFKIRQLYIQHLESDLNSFEYST